MAKNEHSLITMKPNIGRRLGAGERGPSVERVGLVYRSGSPPEEAWSRIPAGLARGLRDLGIESQLIDAEPQLPVMRVAKVWAAAVRRSRYGGMFAPEIRQLRRLTARRRGARPEEVDAIIQMGSDFNLPFPQRLVTYEDATVLQRARVDDFQSTLGAAALRRWVAAQAQCYEAALACCAMSQATADSISADYGIDADKIHVVWAGRNFEPRPISRDWSRPRFFFMGYDWERKNGRLVLQAFSRLKARVPDARLAVAGDHPRIDMEGVAAHGAVDFSDPSRRAHAESLFESATCFVMPSRFEPFGIVYVEAAAAGVPSIGTLVGGARDAVGEGGLLVDPTDENALVDAMATMCNPDRASAMGAAALKRAHLFTWKAVAQRMIDAFDAPAGLARC
jgi:glycosyltransferase involved in cell wall biosynthesis